MSDAEQDLSTVQLIKAVFARAAAYGAIIRGTETVSHANLRPQASARSQISFERQYYSIGQIQGVADVGCFAESGGVTVIVQLIEGP